MKDYDLIEEMNREVYKASNSRKLSKKLKSIYALMDTMFIGIVR